MTIILEELNEVSAEEIDDINISSTKIRSALQEGNIETANEYLSYNYQISGDIIKGDQLGRTIGFPTANIRVNEHFKLIPKNGVYAVNVQLKQGPLFGMLNIGTRPTVNNSNETTIEVHIFDFEENIYGQHMRIEFVKRIRDEKKFSNKEELAAQLELDKSKCLTIAR